MRKAQTAFFPCDSLPAQRPLIAGLALGVLLLFFLAPPRVQGQAAASPARAARASATTAQQPLRPAAQTAGRTGGRGMREGIAVHGWWVIEVRKPDGKLISHTEFENKLQSNGAYELALLLSGYVPGDWMIAIDGGPGISGAPSSPQPVCTNSIYTSGVGPCGMVEGGGYFATQFCPGDGLQCFNTLTVADPGLTQSQFVQLQGSAVSAMSGMITDVETLRTVCSPSVTPSVCETGTNLIREDTFTAASLPTSSTASTPCGGSGQISCAVTVPEAGDTINVTVTISFQ